MAAERKKLEKQRKELQGWIASSKSKLANENFVAKAPPKVIEDAKAKLSEMEERLARVEETLKSLV